MASEAKIGLLLGLAIIFVVAFVINGLPHFGEVDQNDDLALALDGNPPGIGSAVSSNTVFGSGLTPDTFPAETPPSDENNEYSSDLLPGTTPPAEIANNLELNAPDATDDPGAPREVVVKLEPAPPAWPKVHVVRKGDNLGDIAKMYYGSKEGNRRANVLRIFESNRNVLKSPDKIFPGQKLIIPSLWASGAGRKTIEQIFPASMFEPVGSVGRTHL